MPALLVLLLKVVCVYVFLKSDIDLEIKCTSENMLVIFHLLSITLGAELERAEQRDRVTKAFLLKDFSLCALLCVCVCVRARERVSLLAAHAVLFTRILRVTSSFVLIEGSSGPWNARLFDENTGNANCTGSVRKYTLFVTTNCVWRNSRRLKRFPAAP